MTTGINIVMPETKRSLFYGQLSVNSTAGRIIGNVEEMADQFNSYFTTVAEKLRDQLSNTRCDLSKLLSFVESRKDPEVQFSIPSITSSQVGRIILKISPNKASGIDNI